MTRTAIDPIDEARRQWVANGWADAADGMAAVTSIVRVQQLLLKRVHDVLAPFGLTLARFEVLRLLAFSRSGELPVGKISERLQVQAGSVTHAVDRLERDGLVVRRSHPDDGRVVLAALTDDGRALVEAATVPLNEAFRTPPVAGDDLATVVETIDRLRHRLEDAP